MSFDFRVLVLLCVVIAGVVDAACFEEDCSPFTFVGFNREAIGANDPEILLRSIPICVDVVQREESLPLVFAKSIDLLADRYL